MTTPVPFTAGAVLPASQLNANCAYKIVRAATGGVNGTLATAYQNASVIDGVTLATGDRILLKDQTTGSENGIYTVNASGAPTRAVDWDSTIEAVPGVLFVVQEGTANQGTFWRLSNTGSITVGTTAQTFVQFSNSSGPALIRTVLNPSNAVTNAAWPNTNRAKFVRVQRGGVITGIGVHIVTQSGNISAAVCRGAVGRAAATSRVTTSGAVACPVAGFTTISISSTSVDETTDWLALSADNVTFNVSTQVAAGSSLASNLFLGYLAFQDTAHPIPASPATSTEGLSPSPILIGL